MLEYHLTMSSSGGQPSASPPVTAADMPIEVRRLLKSYEFEELRWAEPRARYIIAIEILTRGDDEAEQWLWSLCTRNEIRELFRQFEGAGCGDNDARALLRSKLELTVDAIPDRPFPPFPWRG
jgi:hypothetical protein